MRRTPSFRTLAWSWTRSPSWSLPALLGAALALGACDGGSSSDGGGPPTAAQLKSACDGVFDKIITCSGATTPAGALAASYKVMTCTDANAQALAACASASVLLKQSQSCAAMDCSGAPACGLALVPSLQACVPDGGAGQ